MEPGLYAFLKAKLAKRSFVVIHESHNYNASDHILYKIKNMSLDGKQVRLSSMRNGAPWSDLEYFRLASKAESAAVKRLGKNDKCRTLIQLIEDLTQEYRQLKGKK